MTPIQKYTPHATALHRSLLRHVRIVGRGGDAVLPVSEGNVPELRGHFPGRPVVPAVVLLHGFAQLANALGGGHLIQAVKNAKFRRVVTPENGELKLEVKKEGEEFTGRAYVVDPNGKKSLAAEAEFKTE